MSPDVAASIMTRLLSRSKLSGEEFERTLTRFANERVLYRLGESAIRNRCILKGAGLLALWLPDPYRATRDLDLLASGPADDLAIRELIEEICKVPCAEDGLCFDLSDLRIEAIRPKEEYAGKRARFFARLGRARIRIQLDFGFGDALGVEEEDVQYPTILDNLPAPRLRVYPRDVSLAEKFEAMVRLDLRNSRMKDFHDVWALVGLFAFDGRSLRTAFSACFDRRATPVTGDVPPVLTPDFYANPDLQRRWTAYLRGSDLISAPPASLESVGGQIIRFFVPVWNHIASNQPFVSRWPAGGPWE